jgi:hypothetical protein
VNVIDTTKRTGAAVAIGVVLVAALASVAQASESPPSSAQLAKALQVRGDALNRVYHLGAYATSASSGAAARRALEIRSDALNRVYHLGAYATSASSGAAARRALEIRGDALNARYHLGRYAVISQTGGFDWADAGIGAASMFGLIVAAGGLFLVSRRHRAIGGGSLSRAS